MLDNEIVLGLKACLSFDEVKGKRSDECPYIHHHTCIFDMIGDVYGLVQRQQQRIEELEAAEERMAIRKECEQWISVEDALPDTVDDVWITDGKRVFRGWYDGEMWATGIDVRCDVKMWHALRPALPEVGEG